MYKKIYLHGFLEGVLKLFKCLASSCICMISLWLDLFFGSEVDKPSEFLMKTSNVMEYITLDIQNIEAPRIYDPITWYVSKNILIGFP